MKLYEYAEQYEALKQMAEDENIPPEALADTLESIDDEFETKVDSIACIIKDELATAEAIKKEIEALTARMKRHFYPRPPGGGRQQKRTKFSSVFAQKGEEFASLRRGKRKFAGGVLKRTNFGF